VNGVCRGVRDAWGKDINEEISAKTNRELFPYHPMGAFLEVKGKKGNASGCIRKGCAVWSSDLIQEDGS